MTPARLARWAAIGALVGMVLMIWAVFDSPFAVIVFMSLGQVIGTASLVLYVAAVVLDLRGRGAPEPSRQYGEK